ncbi:ATPase [Algirhabdus cladophorae]|uniref:ATPase n=1 Tax=Algirhabdus cladophorae TaxID=3377108 RepID=UPI003B84A1A1
MIYSSAQDWFDAPAKRVCLFGMSGLGKSYVSNMLREGGDWFHYSVDYRIGTRYMGEAIVDNAKAEAMKVPFLAELLRSDSIYIASNITFENLDPLSTYLGKPGDAALGGLDLAEYQRRQDQHHAAETAALLDTPHFIKRATQLYGYTNFVCDSGGSICEVVDASNPNDPVMHSLSQSLLMVWIEGSDAHTSELVRRFDAAPKPMCYQPRFLLDCWSDYLQEFNAQPDKVNPDDFVRWTYARAMAHRQPLYAAMAKWGVTVSADAVAGVKDVSGFERMIGAALDAA